MLQPVIDIVVKHYQLIPTRLVSTLLSCQQMETTIKQAEEERSKAYENAKHLYEDCRPLKEEIDIMRMRAGLDVMPDFAEETERLKME